MEIPRISRIQLPGGYKDKQKAREELATAEYERPDPLKHHILSAIATIGFPKLYEALMRRDLDFDEAFVGACYALRASNAFFADATRELFPKDAGENREMVGREFLSAMAVKETYKGITPDEIAGMVTAVGLDFVARPSFGDRVFETCGTGGDIGFPPRDAPRKTINASTLSSLVIASLGIPTVKHGSYKNTSAVGSTDAIEGFGARVEQSNVSDIERIFRETGYYFSDAHVFKTVHDLSHLEPRHETINHVLGHMTPPIDKKTRLDKVMGVNEKVHPETIARAFEKISRVGGQNIGNVAVVAGLVTDIDSHQIADYAFVKHLTMLDELSPYSSVVAFVRDGTYAGTFLLHPNDFGLTISSDAIALENKLEVIRDANMKALRGHGVFADYLAMNAGLCLFVAEYASKPDAISEHGPNRGMLRECFARCNRTIAEDRPWKLLRRYVIATGGTFKE